MEWLFSEQRSERVLMTGGIHGNRDGSGEREGANATFVCSGDALVEGVASVRMGALMTSGGKPGGGVLMEPAGDGLRVTATGPDLFVSKVIPARKAVGRLHVAWGDVLRIVRVGLDSWPLGDGLGGESLVYRDGARRAVVETLGLSERAEVWPVSEFPALPTALTQAVRIDRAALGHLRCGVAVGVPGAELGRGTLKYLMGEESENEASVRWQAGTGRPWVSVTCGATTITQRTTRTAE